MKQNDSVSVAKDRLKALLVADRVCCTPDTFNKIQNELYTTISKYFEIIPEKFDIKMTPSYIHITLMGEDT
jgi:cell division topological specificity factor